MPIPRPEIEAVRDAIRCGEYARAQTLWGHCVESLARAIQAGHLTAAELAEAGELVAWANNVVKCERARLLDGLNRMHVAGEYDSPDATATASRLVEASF
jgi:hypothetical protein